MNYPESKFVSEFMAFFKPQPTREIEIFRNLDTLASLIAGVVKPIIGNQS